MDKGDIDFTILLINTQGCIINRGYTTVHVEPLE